MISTKEITISLEEYKNLLIIKGKYEELSSRYPYYIYSPYKYPSITYGQYKTTGEGTKYDDFTISSDEINKGTITTTQMPTSGYSQVMTEPEYFTYTTTKPHLEEDKND